MRHAMNCHVDPIEAEASPEALRTAEQMYLAVAGMGCPNCAHRVRNAILAVPGVVDAEVDAKGAVAQVWYNSSETDVGQVVRGVTLASEGTHHDYMAVPIRRRFPNGVPAAST